MNELFSTIDVARLLQVPEHRINYAYRAGKLPEPIVIAGKRIFTNNDVARAREYFQRHKPWQREETNE
jgi:DNA-binding transcriptional MerR regulator